MSSKTNYFKLGLFVIAATALLAVGVSILGVGSLLRRKILVETYVNESVQGLDIGSPVKYRGVHIGNVKRIGFVHTDYLDVPVSSPLYRYVLIRCVVYSEMLGGKGATDIRPFIRNEVQKGLRARLALQGITGTVYLEVDYVDPKRNPPLAIEWEPEASYIPSVPSLTAQMGDMAISFLDQWEKARIPETLDLARVFLDDADRAVKNLDLGPLREKTEQLIEEVRETNRTVRKIVDDPAIQSVKTDAAETFSGTRRLVDESSDDVKGVLRELRRGSEDFSRATQELRLFLQGNPEVGLPPLERLSRVLANADASAADLPEAVATLNAALSRLERLISSQQDSIATILENLERTTRNLRDVSEDARLYPSRILFGEPPNPVEVGR